MNRVSGKARGLLKWAVMLALVWSCIAPLTAAAESRSGLSALEVALSTPAKFSNTRQLVPVTANTTYDAGIWVKGSGSVLLLVKAGNWGATLAQQKCDASSVWTSCSLTFDAASHTQVTFVISDNYSGTASVLIDDTSLSASGGGGNLLQNAGFENGGASWIVSNNGQWSIGQSGGMGSLPNAPGSVQATAGDGQVSLSWSPVTGADSYQVKRSATSGGVYAVIGSATAAAYTDSGLNNGTTYYYKVSAVNTVGESGDSAAVNATPSATVAAGTYTYAGDWSLQATLANTPAHSGMTQHIPSGVAPNTSYVAKLWLKGDKGVRLMVKADNWGATLAETTCAVSPTAWTECVTPTFNTGASTKLTYVVADGLNGPGGIVYMDEAFLGAPSGVNLLRNPGFEDGYFLGWTLANKLTWAIDEYGVHPPQAPPAPVSYGTIHVDPQGLNGAFTSIRQAVKAAHIGTTILVHDGVYEEGPIFMTQSGTAEHPIVLKALGDDAIVKSNIEVRGQHIRIEGLQFDGEAQYSGILGLLRNAITVYGDHVAVVGNRFQDYVGYAVIAEYQAGTLASDTYIADNYVYSCAAAFQVGSNSIIEYNEVERINVHLTDEPQGDFLRVFGNDIIVRYNYLHGTRLEDLYRPSTPADPAHADVVQSWDDINIEVKRVLIENNVFLGFYHQGLMLENDKNGVNGIYLISDWVVRNNVFGGIGSSAAFLGKTNGGIPNMLFENNTFTSAVTDGVRAYFGVNAVGTGGSTTLRNNIFVGFGASSYGASQGSTIDADYNLIYDSSVPVVTGPHDIVGLDPKFVNFDPLRGEDELPLNDWRLQPDSPAIDNGVARSYTSDLDGNTRPTGLGFDIGAYEFVGTPGNIPPVASLVGISDGQVETVGSTVEVLIQARDAQGIQKVELYKDGLLVDTLTAAPYVFDYEMEAGIQRLHAVAYDTVGNSSASREVMLVGTSSSYILAERNWQNSSFPTITGQATVEFTIIPTRDMINGVIGLSYGTAGAYSALASIVRLNTDGLFDAYTTGGYASESTQTYEKGKLYRVRLEVDATSKTYRVLITPDGGTTQVIGEAFAFRSQATALNNLAVFAETGNMLVMDVEVLPYNRQEVGS